MKEFDLDSIDAYSLEPKLRTEEDVERSKRLERDLQRFLETYYA